MEKNGILVLENGETFLGESFGHAGTHFGEVVFNTSMTGYQEILTDPSYKKQIITMTYPEIGNYGVKKEENESPTIHAEGFIVKNYNHNFYNPENNEPLNNFLKRKKIVALKNIDTRKLTKLLRSQGALEAVISSESLNPASLLKRLKEQPRFNTLNLPAKVSTKKFYYYHQDKNHSLTIGVWDFGVKENILRILKSYQVNVLVIPLKTSLEEMLAYPLNGLLLSNGPGNPDATDPVLLETILSLVGRLPIFGICFGHQILLKALGHSVYKLKFGHHGANHPIQNLKSKLTQVSSQNHGYAISINSNSNLKNSPELMEINLNDHTVAGFYSSKLKCFSLQYHPEGAPGPEDNYFHFNNFINMIKKEYQKIIKNA